MTTIRNITNAQKMSSPRFHQLFSLCAVFLIMLASISALSTFTQHSTNAHASSGSFTFTAAGDYSNSAGTSANLKLIAGSGAKFNLALGDFNYDPAITADQWSAYVKSNLPVNFPFEIIAGNEDTADVGNYIADLPDHLGGISGTYGKEYFFDYPSGAPLVRFIMISPGGILPGYSYSIGSSHYNWLSQQIDGARNAGIPWVIVGMHEYCMAIGNQPCFIGSDLENLLVSKKVDLVLQGHTHSYQVSKQLALNSNTCPSIPVGNYNAACVTNGSAKMTKGTGTVFVITGTGGAPLFSPSPGDPQAAFFRASNNQTWGISRFTISPTQISMKFLPGSGGSFSDSFTITNPNPPTPTVTLSPTPTMTPSPSPTSPPSPTPVPGGRPVNKLWYFAEGRVGGGFKEYLTLANPTNNDCHVNIRYLYIPDGGTPQTKTLALDVSPNRRVTQAVNADLNVANTQSPGSSDSATITVDSTTTPNCAGIVAERPMYFNALGVNSSSDVIGATQTGTNFYFADIPTGNQPSGGSYASFIPILNPGTASTTVTATYFANGEQVGTQQAVVPGGARGTLQPGNVSPSLPPRVEAVVISDQPVVVERPTYFTNINGGNAQIVSGAADVVGIQNPAQDFLFAEGYTGGQFQENLVLANFNQSQVSANVILEFANGHTQTVPATIGQQSQTFLNVNQAVANHLGTCDINPCQPTPQVSMEVQASGPIVAEREMFFHYSHTDSLGRTMSAMGGTDVIGQVGPAVATVYTFAEGYTNVGYNEWLTLQNPTTNPETITLTLLNEAGSKYAFTVNVGARTRSTVDITLTVAQHMIQPGASSASYEVSMTAQSSSGPFLAERPMYSNTGAGGTQGGTDVIGYTAG